MKETVNVIITDANRYIPFIHALSPINTPISIEKSIYEQLKILGFTVIIVDSVLPKYEIPSQSAVETIETSKEETVEVESEEEVVEVESEEEVVAEETEEVITEEQIKEMSVKELKSLLTEYEVEFKSNAKLNQLQDLALELIQ